ncbi:MAG: PLxRFG domain-containing protein [Bdellovibrio sp.]
MELDFRGDEPVKGSATTAKAQDDELDFGGDPVVERSGYLGASAKAGLYDLAGQAATVIDTLNPFTTSEKDLAVLFKNDPAQFKHFTEKSLNSTYQRVAKNASAKAEQTMSNDNLTPEAQALRDKKYATTDTGEAAWASPERVVGDVIRSAPSSMVLMGAGIAGKMAASEAYTASIAAGATETMARAAAMRAAASATGAVAAAGEGTIGGAAGFNQAQAEGEKMTEEQLLQSPYYRQLRKDGYSPDTAKAMAVQRAAQSAGMGAGAVDAVVAGAGGAAFGRVLGAGAGRGATMAAGMAEQGVTEFIQSPGEEGSGNVAKKAYLDPTQEVTEGMLEAAIGGLVVGGASGAPTAILGKSGHAEKEREKVLSAAAADLEVKEGTGFTKAEADATAEASGAKAAKPRLNARQSRVAIEAQRQGVKPEDALAVMGLESRGRSDAQNPNSSANGLFQIIDSTWEELGGGDRNDEATQIRNGVAYLAKVAKQWKQTTGMEPNSAEIYMGHMLGPKGATNLWTASQGNPDGAFADTVRKWDPRNAEAIVKNNRFTGMTNAQVYAEITRRVQTEQLRLGLNAQANRDLLASNAGDQVDDSDMEGADELAAELDAILAEDEFTPLTEEEQRLQQAEEATISPELVQPTEEHRELDQMNETVEAPAPAPIPVLPRELSGASVRYGVFGKGNYQVEFDNDLDKAAYIVAKPGDRSKADARYLDFVMQNSGMTEDEARAYGKSIIAQVKELVHAVQDPLQTSVRVEGSKATRPDSFVSLDEEGTRNRYRNPNDLVPITKLPIAAARDQDALGQNLAARGVQPGEVVAVNIDSAHSPAGYVQAAQETLQGWVDKFMPNAAMILSFRTMDPNKVAGWLGHKQVGVRTRVSKRAGQKYIHQLNLRNATNLGVTDDGSSNPSTQRKIAYSMAHEFGHALAEEQFTRGWPDDLVQKMDKMGLEELWTEQDLARMPADAAAVMREYNALKERVLRDPTMSARDFIETWLSPWKTAHGRDSKTGVRQGAESFARMYIGEGRAKQLDTLTANQFARMMDPDTDIMSPHEYMAEQFARYAYSRKLLENSPLGVKEFFQRTFEVLRDFFTTMKRSGIAEPGIQFAAWVDSLTATSIRQGTNETLPKAPTQAAPAAKPRLRSAPAVSVPVDEAAPVSKAAAPGTLNVDIAGRAAQMAFNDSDGQWYQVGAGGIPTGGPLGEAIQQAKRALGQRFRAQDAQERQAKESRSIKAAKPNILPPVVEKPNMAETIAPEVTPEIKAAAEQVMRSPEMQELRRDNPEMYGELRDLIRQGKYDEWKFEVTQYLPDEIADKIRWDTDNPEHTTLREVQMQLENSLPARTGIKYWFGNGLRRLSDAKYYTMTLTQMAYANPFSAGLQFLNKSKNDFKTYKSRLEFAAVNNAQRWSKLGKEQAGLLEKAMRQEHFDGVHLFDLTQVNNTWRVTPNANVEAYANRMGLDEDTVKLWMDLKNSHLQHMGNLQSVLVNKAKERLANKPLTLKKKVAELNQMFEQIRQAPFLPQTRFGPYAIHVLEDTLDGRQVVHVEFFESASVRDEAVKELTKHLKPGQQIRPAKYTNSTSILRTLPPQLLSTWAEEFDLTPQQRKELRLIADVVTRNQQTRRYSTQLAGISGANKDLLRNYADFMSHNANNIAKLRFRDKFNKSLRLLAEETRQYEEEGDYKGHDEMVKLSRFAQGYVDHMLNPAQEFHMLRSFVVMKQLWGNIKTALANVNSLAQLWALSSRQQGLLAGSASTAKTSLKVLEQSVRNLGNRVLRQPVEGGQVFSEDERYALELAKRNGLLDETFAAQLASFSNADTLSRLNKQAGSMFRQVTWMGMLPQHAVENYTRRVTLLNQFNTYMKQGMDKKNAFDAAQTDLYLLQGDNTQVNRPAFMRGTASMFLIYYGYVQNMLYLMTGAQERARNMREAIDTVPGLSRDEAKRYYKTNKIGGETVKMWMAYAFLGGLMGLPGAEDLDKILGLVADKVFGKDFSLKEYAFKLASFIAEEAHGIGLDVNPRSIVHGNMSDFNLFGLLPSVDVSPSMSLGQVLPGAGGIDKLGQRGGAGEFLIGALGPVGSLVKDLQKAFSDDPSMMSKMGLLLPNTVNGWAKTWKEHQHGVLYPSGGKVTFDQKTGTVRDLTTGEELSRLMGFTPSIISSNKELHWMQKDKADFWTSRRNQLTAQLWEAHKQNDREAIADVKRDIQAFNEKADPKLRLTQKEVAQSIKKRKQNALRDTKRLSAAKRYSSMYREVEEDFTGQ